MLNLVPAHVGQAQIAHLHQPDPARHYAKAVDELAFTAISDHVLFGGFRQHLHAEAKAQQRLFGGANKGHQPPFVEVLHGGHRRADAGQDQLVSLLDIGRLAGNQRLHAEALERHSDRGQIRAAGVDDDQFLIVHRALPMSIGEIRTITAVPIMTRFCLLISITIPLCWRGARTLPPGWPDAGRGQSP